MKKTILILSLFFCATFVKAQSDATIEETKAFLVEKINNAGWAHAEFIYEGRTQVLNYFDMEFIGESKVVFYWKHNDFAFGNNDHEWIVFDPTTAEISDIAFGIEKEEYYGIYKVILFTKKSNGFTVEGEDGEKRLRSDFYLQFNQEDHADRFIKAFQHLLKLYGVEEDKF